MELTEVSVLTALADDAFCVRQGGETVGFDPLFSTLALAVASIRRALTKTTLAWASSRRRAGRRRTPGHAVLHSCSCGGTRQQARLCTGPTDKYEVVSSLFLHLMSSDFGELASWMRVGSSVPGALGSAHWMHGDSSTGRCSEAPDGHDAVRALVELEELASSRISAYWAHWVCFMEPGNASHAIVQGHRGRAGGLCVRRLREGDRVGASCGRSRACAGSPWDP